MVEAHTKSWPHGTGVADGIRNYGADRVDRRSNLDGQAVNAFDRPQASHREIAEALRWSQTVIDLADGELAKRAKGNRTSDWPLITALAHALATRGTARYALGDSGWRTDLDQAVAKARSLGPLPYAVIIGYSNVSR